MYVLNNKFTEYNYTITIIGCGGTGAFVADGLCRIIPEFTARLVLVDFDRVEERNCSRQNFFRKDVGKFKSEVVATRLSRDYNIPIGYAVSPIQFTQVFYPGIVVGCVDNGKARKDITKRLSDSKSLDWCGGNNPVRTARLWWVDAGNGENYGQILIGNAEVHQLNNTFLSEQQVCAALPYPTIQSPDLLSQAPPVTRDCAEIAEQAPVINRVMASLAIEVVRRILNGTCSWMQLWLDLEAGTLTPVYATPENVASISKKKVNDLVRKEI